MPPDTNDNLLVQIHEYHTCYRHSPSLQQQKQLKNAAKVVGYETCERWSAHINLTSEKHTPVHTCQQCMTKKRVLSLEGVLALE
jgi:hypothetical protein